MKGKLIVLDGTDGSGKKTQLDLLEKRLKKESYRVKTIDFPRYKDSFYGKMVAKYLRGEYGDIYEANPYFVSLLYAGDRFLAKDKILDWLNKGYIVLTNRYVSANLAFQSAKLPQKEREKYLVWESELEYKINQLPEENQVIFLHVPAEIAQKLVEKRMDKKDIYDTNLTFQKNVEQQYLFLAKKFNWPIIKCTKNQKILSREEIAEKIWQNVKKYL